MALQMANSQPTDVPAADVAVLFDRRRLRVARELRGLSQVQLAREIGGIRAASLSQFEQGHAKPSSATLQRLAVALRVPLAFFAAPARPDVVGATNGFFRSLRSAPPRDRQRALAHVELAREVARELERFVRLPDVDLPRTQGELSVQATREEIERAAANVRTQWQVPPGPIDDMVLLLERHGIVTTRLNVGHTEIDAFSVPFADRPVVVLGADKNLRDRSRFDAAHELAHLVLHREDQAGNKVIEAQANQFAAAFLMPADEIRGQLPAKADWPTLLRLKAHWHVSIGALLRRAFTLDVMDERIYVQALKVMSAKGWRKHEPGNLGSPERPLLLRRAVDVASGIGVPLALLAQQAGLPDEEVRMIVGVEPDERPAVEL
ncbi:helix-turn-helix domain-containing protein [Micromonospora sp. CPCC 206061]|uniref:helix-turn-helix domain-containing protein n=1 Tax=Micromonospora sp. CPCC 206061 TaxID=3122410 RepID=UPI002FF05CD5